LEIFLYTYDKAVSFQSREAFGGAAFLSHHWKNMGKYVKSILGWKHGKEVATRNKKREGIRRPYRGNARESVIQALDSSGEKK